MPAMATAVAAHTLVNQTITEGTIHVRSLNLQRCKSEMDLLARYLSASELDRAWRFHFQDDYDRYVAARACLRLQLGRFLDCDPKSLLFQYTSHGKPFIENRGIEFNLSHSGDWVLFAFTRFREIGVDIERVRPISDMRDVAKQNFAASELARWEATPSQDWVQAFYRCWTRKESFIKAIGQGLSCPLDSFEVSFALHEPCCLMSVHGDHALAAPWWIADLPEFEGYAAAVTARGANLDNISLVVREIGSADLRGSGIE